MYCPKCAAQTATGQRFCRNCGTNLGLILDAMEGKRGQLDFETLKRDLRDLGSSLRSGFEEASSAFKNTRRLDQPQPAPNVQPAQVVIPNLSREVEKALKKVKAAHTRKYSLQQATLSFLGSGALMFVWYQLLEAAANSGLLQSLELIILENANAPVVGLVPVFRLLWLLALIPMARGAAHLINAIFFAPPKPEKEPATPGEFAQGYIQPVPGAQSYAQSAPGAQTYVQPAPSYVSAVPSGTTNDLEKELAAQPQSSVTEDATLRFDPK